MLLVDKIMHLVKTQSNRSIHILLKQISAMKKYSHMVALEQMKVSFTFVLNNKSTNSFICDLMLSYHNKLSIFPKSWAIKK